MRWRDRFLLRRPLARWLAVSIAVHVVVLTAVASWWARTRPEPPPISVRLLPEPLAEPPLEPEPELAPLRFHEPTSPRVKESLELPRETLALAPPPPDVPLEAEAVGGGLDIDLPAARGLGSFALGASGAGLAGRGIGAGNGWGTRGTFQEFVGGLRQSGLDVVFVIDATGSMGWLIREVKERVVALSGAIRSLVPVTRFGVVAYRDDDDPEFLVEVEPLSLQASRIERFLDGLEARGGGDMPEAVDAGLRAAIERAGWKSGSHQVIIVIGDAPPHAERLEQTLAVARQFHARGGVVTTVDVRFDANPSLAAARLGKRVEELQTIGRGGVMPEFDRLARAGGGDGTTLEGDQRVVRQLGVLIFGRRWADDVRPLLGDL